MSRLALFLYERTGNMARPWKEAGFDVLCLDIEHSVRVPPEDCERCDLRTLGPALSIMARRGYSLSDVVFMGASPPCTDVACSGARDLAKKGLRALAGSLEMFATAQEMASLIDAPGTLRTQGPPSLRIGARPITASIHISTRCLSRQTTTRKRLGSGRAADL